jgi:putative ABC transport system substrate-binding protein
MPFARLKRREFLSLLGGAAAWPLAARAQQLVMPVIGFLLPLSRSDSLSGLVAFRQGLRERDFTEGTNVAIEYRFAEGHPERLPALAADLVERRVAVIAAGARGGEAAKAATSTIPIVFLSGGDPVRTGLVANLNRPGGNVTGVTLLSLDIETKRLGLLRDLVPQAGTFAVLVDSTNASIDHQVQDVENAAHSIGMAVRIVTVGGEQDFDSAFATMAREGARALMITGSTYFVFHRDRLAALAADHKIPTIYEVRRYAEAGGLLSYGASNADAWRQIGNYVGRILKGEKPADLPVMQPTKFELVINLKAAKALGLQIPDKLLAIADEVIE